MKAREIEAALRRRFVDELGGWAFLREVTIDDLAAQEAHTDPLVAPLAPLARRIDALLIATAPRAKPIPHERLAVEIKVSRADFRRDTDEKRRAWFDVSHRFAYATPAGLVHDWEIPAGCGLIEVDGTSVRWAVRAPRRPDVPTAFSDRFVAYLAGRASRAEHIAHPPCCWGWWAVSRRGTGMSGDTLFDTVQPALADRECPRCHDRIGHRDALSDAACAYRAATTQAIRDLAAERDASDGPAADDLLAHLRGVFSDADAYRAASTVLNLGWRKTIPTGASE